MKMLPQIFYLNGPSSAGKSTLAKGLQDELLKKLGLPYYHLQMDAFLGGMPEGVNVWDQVLTEGVFQGRAVPGYWWKRLSTGVSLQAGSYAQEVYGAYHKVAELLASLGMKLIIDDVSLELEEVEAWSSLLKSYTHRSVYLSAEAAVLECREQARDDRMPGSAIFQAAAPAREARYDRVLDSGRLSLPEQIAIVLGQSTDVA